jgi:NAD+ synthase
LVKDEKAYRELTSTEEKILSIKSWLREKLKESCCEGFIIGLSGGIDSAVVSVLCKEVCPYNTLGIIMPCYSNPDDEKFARIHAEDFDIDTKIVRLNTTYDSLKEAIGDEREFSDQLPLDLANIKPRIRMTTLYYFANKYNYLVVGTGNKSEELIGYFTKYGDGGVDILPIGDLLKEEVYEIGKELGICNEIMNRPPSAGLWDGQTDEKELGVSYETVDYLIKTMEKNNHKSNPPTVFKK